MPRKEKQFSFRLDASLRAAIDLLAARHGCTPAEAVRRAIIIAAVAMTPRRQGRVRRQERAR